MGCWNQLCQNQDVLRIGSDLTRALEESAANGLTTWELLVMDLWRHVLKLK